MLKVSYLEHLTIVVRDVARSVRFYKEVLGLEDGPVWQDELVMLRCGPTYLAIGAWGEGKQRGPRSPIGVDHFAFRVDAATYQRARHELPARGVEVEYESDHGINQSLYFRDPDDNILELACYELQGAAHKMPLHPERWQRSSAEVAPWGPPSEDFVEPALADFAHGRSSHDG
jgi:catechol 2,3-dioxygenase-like lactoylglutathione lyase family enzyme